MLPLQPPLQPSLQKRQATIDRLRSEQFDFVIIGGGINGAGIARDAALRGYKVALIEKSDFADGTSSRSSRLIHGGLRYLEQGEVGLVFESVSERAQLARLARHLVRPLPFVFPVYRGDPRQLATVSAGFWIYDALALFRNYRQHRRLSSNEMVRTIVGIKPSDLKGGVLYYDYQTNDARIVLENILSAQAAGSQILSRGEVKAFNYTNSVINSVTVFDRLSGASFEVCGQVFIAAAGPWTDELLQRTRKASTWLRPTKGVHLVIPAERLPVSVAVVMRHPADGRIHFILPYFERTVIGTTDTDFSGDPQQVRTTKEDVDYLLASTNHYFPTARLTPNDIISSWAGVRPLLGDSDDESPSQVSREHRIETRNDALVIIAGGKLTTYRKMAAECVDIAVETLDRLGGTPTEHESQTARCRLPGGAHLKTETDLEKLIEQLANRLNNPESAQHLAWTYGERAIELLDDAAAIQKKLISDIKLTDRIVSELPHLWGEITFAVRHELALGLCDVLIRRTQLFYRARDQGVGIAEKAARFLAAELNWDEDEIQRQVNDYKQAVAQNQSWRGTS